MNIIIDLTPKQMDELGPQLDAMEISHRVNLIDIEWENPHKKESVYQVALGEDLHQMATDFNHILERMGMVARFRDPDELNMEEKIPDAVLAEPERQVVERLRPQPNRNLA